MSGDRRVDPRGLERRYPVVIGRRDWPTPPATPARMIRPRQLRMVASARSPWRNIGDVLMWTVLFGVVVYLVAQGIRAVWGLL